MPRRLPALAVARFSKFRSCSTKKNIPDFHRGCFFVYAGHDTSSGVKVSNEPVRRNQIAEDKFAPARARMKEVGSEVRRTRTGNGYKAYSRASLHYKAKPQP